MHEVIHNIHKQKNVGRPEKSVGKGTGVLWNTTRRSENQTKRIPVWEKELSENYSNPKTIELNCCKNENKCVIMFIQ